MQMKTKFIIPAAAILALGANAQDAPDSGDILKEVQPPKIQKPQKPLPKVDSEQYKPPMAPDSEVKVTVSGFDISGNTVYSDEKLRALLKEYKGKKLSLSQLYEAARVITKYYRDNGYFVARAYIPNQEIDDDNPVVEIAVIEGRYDSFDMKNDSHVDTSVVQGFMDRLTDGAIVSSQSLERQMLLINDLGGARVADARIHPGDTVGTSKFTIGIDREKRFSGYAMADNYGSRYTGIHRLNLGGFVNGLSGRGDILGFTALLSQNANLKNAGVSYETHIGYSGLKAKFNAAYTDYEIGKELEDLEASGDTLDLSAALSYPLIKTRAHTLVLKGAYNHKDLNDKTAMSDVQKSVDSFILSLSDEQNTAFFGQAGRINTGASLTIGELSLDSADAKAQYGSKRGSFAKVEASLKHRQFLSSKLSLQSRLQVQSGIDNQNMDSSQNFSPAGTYGVRGYKSGEVSGDKGYLASLQLDYSLPAYKNVRHRVFPFLDHAKVWYDQNPQDDAEDNDRVLYAAGIGYSASYKAMNLQATLARGFGPDRTPSADGGRADENLLLVQAMWRF